jgi:hypothetical protein
LWVKYFTSSNEVLNLLKTSDISDFRVEIRRTFNTRSEAIAWEARVNKRILNRKNVLNKCAWPAVSEDAQKLSKISKAIIGDDGLTPAQRGGLKWKMIKNK